MDIMEISPVFVVGEKLQSDMKNGILFIIHRLYFDNQAKKGGIDRILEYFEKNSLVSIIEHPFEKINHPSEFTSVRFKQKHTALFSTPYIWLEEIIINLVWVLRSGQTYSLIVASDPLNFLSSFILKMLRRTKKIQFHSTDYSKPRFSQVYLEFIYQLLYRFALNKADLVTCVSDRMLQNARNLLGTARTDHCILLPNSPNYSDMPRFTSSSKNKYTISLMIGRWGNQLDENLLIKAIEIVAKSYPKIKIHIIGEVADTYRTIFKKNNVSRFVKFYGILPYRKALKIMSKSYIGITIYKPKESYLAFADSIKIREYAAAGVPSVCDTVYGNAKEAQDVNAALIYKNPSEMAQHIVQLITDSKLYSSMRLSSLRWAKKNDKENMLRSIYNTHYA